MSSILKTQHICLRRRLGARRTTWFLRGILVAAVTHSFLAVADLSVEIENFSTDLGEPVDFHEEFSPHKERKISEIELPDSSAWPGISVVSQQRPYASSSEILAGVQIQNSMSAAKIVRTKVIEVDVLQEKNRSGSSPSNVQSAEGKIHFPLDVPESEILRVSRTFHGMIQESLAAKSGPFSEEFLGSLATSEPMTGEKLAELETSLIDENPADEGYALGEELGWQAEVKGLDPFKTYTVVNGQIRAVTPTQVSRQTYAAPDFVQQRLGLQSQEAASMPTSTPLIRQEQTAELNMTQAEISKGLGEIMSTSSAAALDASGSRSDRVSVRGRVIVPSGFAPDKVILRLGGTAFQVQTDASGAFELRDVPRGTRFELLVWHMEGSLTRRLIPITASGREKSLDIHLQKLADVDSLAGAFGVVQQMNQGGFCAKIESHSAEELIGAQVEVSGMRRSLQTHFFSDASLPSSMQTELSSDGRICVFNIDESVVDVKVALVNGIRRQFVVHVEPSTFEHDLLFDVSESIYRRVSLMEPLDTQQVLELSAQGVFPEFGDRKLRDWIHRNDVPVWTQVSRFTMQSDPSYSMVRSDADSLYFFPGGQEFVEVRLAPDLPGAPLSRVILSRDSLLTESMLKQFGHLAQQSLQDRSQVMSIAALDADAWDDIVIQNPDLPTLHGKTTGGLYLSIDPEGLGFSAKDLVVSVRDTWTGKDVCSVQPLRSSTEIKSGRLLRAACGTSPGQYALIIESRDGALLWSDVVRVRSGDVQTVTVLDPKF